MLLVVTLNDDLSFSLLILLICGTLFHISFYAGSLLLLLVKLVHN